MEPAITWIGHATLLRAGGRREHPDRSDLLAARVAARLPRTEAPRRSRHRARRPAAHRRGRDLAQPLRPPRRCAACRPLAAQPGGSPVFIVPLGLKAWFAKRGIERVVELDWWQTHTVGAVEVVLTPVQHWSGRSLTDRMATLWGGYALFAPDFQVFFAGDTGTRRTSPTSARASRRARAQRMAAASTSRCCRSAPTSRAGSCSRSTSIRQKRCRSTST